MKRILQLLTSLVLVASAFGPLAPAAHADSFEDRVLDLANHERTSRGLAPLSLAGELQSAARGYAAAMAGGGFFSHDGPDGSTPQSRIERAGYGGWSFAAENIAAGQGSPDSVMASWMNSEGHRKNLLDPRAREIGIGHVYKAGTQYGHYWVQDFGARSDRGMAARAVAPPAAGTAPQANAPGCGFALGFAALHDVLPGVVGGCKVNEHHNPDNGDGLQETAGGLLVWRKADNFTAFTDGNRTWVNGPYGVQTRLNNERFSWEG
jgi:uncharacterized protein YkwD